MDRVLKANAEYDKHGGKWKLERVQGLKTVWDQLWGRDRHREKTAKADRMDRGS